MIYKEVHTFNVYNLMYLDICKYPWYYHYDSGNSHIQHLPDFPCVPLFLWVHVVWPLNIWYLLITLWSVQYCTVSYSAAELELIHIAEMTLYKHQTKALHFPYTTVSSGLLPSGYISKRTKIKISKRYLHTHVHGIIHNN